LTKCSGHVSYRICQFLCYLNVIYFDLNRMIEILWCNRLHFPGAMVMVVNVSKSVSPTDTLSTHDPWPQMNTTIEGGAVTKLIHLVTKSQIWIWMTFISQTANLLYIIKTLNEEKRKYTFYFSENHLSWFFVVNFSIIFYCHVHDQYKEWYDYSYISQSQLMVNNEMKIHIF